MASINQQFRRFALQRPSAAQKTAMHQLWATAKTCDWPDLPPEQPEPPAGVQGLASRCIGLRYLLASGLEWAGRRLLTAGVRLRYRRALRQPTQTGINTLWFWFAGVCVALVISAMSGCANPAQQQAETSMRDLKACNLAIENAPEYAPLRYRFEQLASNDLATDKEIRLFQGRAYARRGV
jgi:hypothetical protein